jgi:hypothetical protein
MSSPQEPSMSIVAAVHMQWSGADGCTVAASTASLAIIDATEKGMMGENASAGSWSTDNSDKGGARKEGGKSWDGIGEDGCRHVRWKGTDA